MLSVRWNVVGRVVSGYDRHIPLLVIVIIFPLSYVRVGMSTILANVTEVSCRRSPIRMRDMIECGTLQGPINPVMNCRTFSSLAVLCSR